jgi:hypothetical protein
MKFIKQADHIKEITGININSGGMRRYLAACERRIFD